MRILYVSQYFTPEMGAPSVRVEQLAREWAAGGHDVTILTAFPNHPTGRIYPGFRTRFLRLVESRREHGVRIIRTVHLPTANRAGWERMASYSSFAASASLIAAVLPPVDVVIATSPQLLVGLVGWLRTRLRRAPFVFEVRDLWPESITASQVRPESSPLIAALGTLARFLYARADRIVTVTGAMRSYLIEQRAVPSENVSVISGGVDIDQFRPLKQRDLARTQWSLSDRFVASYVGTHGAAHGLETLLDAAAILSHKAPDVLLVLAGEGAEKKRLKSLAQRKQITNVRFIDRQPLDRIPSLLGASDACLALLRSQELFATVVPTKIYEYMACARPVISNIPGETQRLLETSGAGLSVIAGSAGALADAILELRRDPHRAAAFGRSGREYAASNRTWAKISHDYMDLLEEVVALRRERDAGRGPYEAPP